MPNWKQDDPKWVKDEHLKAYRRADAELRGAQRTISNLQSENHMLKQKLDLINKETERVLSPTGSQEELFDLEKRGSAYALVLVRVQQLARGALKKRV